ncbi:hypothetical protein ZIOFF_052590 [Zingiber officinale]|uniref:Uncharacterized protein n=1 Tax=Zingiber officinale TaxID=94328 RepID=A0A8J5KVJ9_ZINOF|nr:hypothetical protein ZIOFF_052590 [Zingiber officinale]
MAIMDMKTVAVAVVRHFDFEVLGGEGRKTPKFALGLTVSLAGGLPVQVVGGSEASLPVVVRPREARSRNSIPPPPLLWLPPLKER